MRSAPVISVSSDIDICQTRNYDTKEGFYSMMNAIQVPFHDGTSPFIRTH